MSLTQVHESKVWQKREFDSGGSFGIPKLCVCLVHKVETTNEKGGAKVGPTHPTFNEGGLRAKLIDAPTVGEMKLPRHI